MKWFKKKETECTGVEPTIANCNADAMHEKYKYIVNIYEHNPRIENIIECMGVCHICTDDISKYSGDFIQLSDCWYRVLQRYKFSENDYGLVVEDMTYYHELDEYKINKKDNNNER